MGSTPSPPPAPDPKETIAAQSAADKEAIAAQARFNRINEVTPTGTLTYEGTPGEAGYTRRVSLTPDQQRLLDLQEGIAIDSYGLANNALGRVSSVISSGFPARDLPGVRNINETDIPQRVLGMNAKDIEGMQQQVSDRAYNEFLRRNSSEFDYGDEQLMQSLADRGIAEGSDLYNRELRRRNQQVADAKAGASFEAFGLGQDYGLKQADFANQQRSGSLSEALALQQREQDLRNASLNEQKLLRDVPLSDISMLLGYGSPQSPQVSGLSQVNIQPVPVADIINQDYQNRIAAYNARLQGGGNILGSLIGAAGTVAGAYFGGPAGAATGGSIGRLIR